MKYSYFFTILFGLLSFACNNNQEEVIPEKVTEVTDPTLPTEETMCDISGASTVSPNSKEFYTYNYDFPSTDINWSVQSGDITILGGQYSSTVYVEFGYGFTGGTLNAYGSNDNDINCSENFTISKSSVCTPPTNVSIHQTSGQCVGGSFTFTAYSSGSINSGSYSWSVSHGATITSGQGTQTITVAAPSGGFSISVNHTNDCQSTQVSGFTLAQFNSDC
ncbi:MAG: hypothetical protein WBB45_06305 [Cyclobacteriaceae bacterium]